MTDPEKNEEKLENLPTPEGAGEGEGEPAKPVEDEATKLERQRKEEESALRAALSSKLDKFGYIVMPSDAKQPILDVATRRALFEWMAEMNAKKALKKVGVEPRMRVMLDGPPGCGKTTLAHHVAARMGVPMLVVMPNTINTKWVGESAANIGHLFKAARQSPDGLVLFFDEFDAIARDRGSDRGLHSEAQGVTVALLGEMDRHEGMVFAATNQADAIDSAVHRRFNLRMSINLPGPEEREAVIGLYMRPLEVDGDVIKALSAALEHASPALIKDVCEAIKRGLVLAPKLNFSTELGALIRRAVQTIKPHENATVPRLWGNVAEHIERLDAAAEGHWPPEMPK